LDNPVKPTHFVLPEYPREEWEKHGDFSVKVHLVLDAEGNVRFPKVIDSPVSEMNKVILDTAYTWRFAPPRKDGEPVLTQFRFPLTLELDPESQRVYELTNLTSPPRPILRNPPSYPSHLRKSGTSGDVVLSFVVNKEGRVQNIQVESATPGFAEAARDAVRTWVFEPGEKDGVPVNTRVRIPIPFRIRR